MDRTNLLNRWVGASRLIERKNGAGNEVRTRDPKLVTVARYPLS